MKPKKFVIVETGKGRYHVASLELGRRDKYVSYAVSTTEARARMLLEQLEYGSQNYDDIMKKIRENADVPEGYERVKK